MKTIKTIIIAVAVVCMIFSASSANQSNNGNITLNVKIYDDYEYAANVKFGDFKVKILDMTNNNEIGFTQATRSFNIVLERDRHYLIYISRNGYATKFFEISTDGASSNFEHTFFVDIILMKKSELAENEMNYPSAVVTCRAETDEEFEIIDIGTTVIYQKSLLPYDAIK